LESVDEVSVLGALDFESVLTLGLLPPPLDDDPSPDVLEEPEP
jgi:hypothetical protein